MVEIDGKSYNEVIFKNRKHVNKNLWQKENEKKNEIRGHLEKLQLWSLLAFRRKHS